MKTQTLIFFVIGFIWWYINSFNPLLSNEPLNGAKIFNLNCARCHNPRTANDYSDREWKVVMPHMRVKAHLTEAETKAIIEFLKQSNKPEHPTQSQQPNSTTLKGKELIEKFQCKGCHQINGNGGTLGPNLNQTVRTKGKEFIIKKLKDPKFNNPSSTMPKFPLSDAEIQAIADYLQKMAP